MGALMPELSLAPFAGSGSATASRHSAILSPVIRLRNHHSLAEDRTALHASPFGLRDRGRGRPLRDGPGLVTRQGS